MPSFWYYSHFNIPLTISAATFSAQAHYHPVIFPWLFPVMQISLSGSIWSTVSVSVERFLSVVQFRSR
jgi:hypothetical protein